LGVATIKPEGSVSVNPTPLRETVAFGLVRAKVKDVVWFRGTVGPANDLAIVGGAMTVIVAVAEVPKAPPAEAISEVTLALTPPLIAVTFTAKLQNALAAKVAPDRLILVDPAVAVMMPPPQPPARPLGVDTTKPAGNTSVKPMPPTENEVFGLAIVNVRLVLEFNRMALAPNVLLIIGERPAITMPVPTVRGRKFETGSDVEYRMLLTCAGVSAGLFDMRRAAIDAACGAAAEVPQKPPVKSGAPEGTQSAAVKSTLGKVVPPLVPNKKFPGVIGLPLGS
jgi:hypothetical protein